MIQYTAIYKKESGAYVSPDRHFQAKDGKEATEIAKGLIQPGETLSGILYIPHF